MLRPRTASLTLALLALAAGCSSKSSAPAERSVDAVAPQESAPEVEGDASPSEPAPAGGAAIEPEPAAEADAAAGPSKAARVPADKALAPSRIQIAEPKTNGGIHRDIIRRKVLDHQADLQACAEGHELGGTLAVKLEVDARGVVGDVELGSQSGLDDREFVDCVLALVSKWSFAGEATAAASVELQFEIAAQAGR
ncbi:MAG: AgmX/PglI C-terminal domain-containing protein [Enhygromyxa sp.]